MKADKNNDIDDKFKSKNNNSIKINNNNNNNIRDEISIYTR